MLTSDNEYENLDKTQIKRGYHLYVNRKYGIYTHHGIVITKNDLNRIAAELVPNQCNIESLMIIEQNRGGLQIVTLSEFQGPSTRHGLPKINCVRYSVSSEIFHQSSRGTCYMIKCLDEDTIVNNAIEIFNDHQHNIWKSEQIPYWSKIVTGGAISVGFGFVIRALFTFFKKIALNVVKVGDRAIQDGVSVGILSIDDIIRTSLKGNAIAAAISFSIEASILTVRVLIYYFRENDREKNLARKWAITPEDYCRKMTQAGFANLFAFGAAAGAVAIVTLAVTTLSGGWTIALSIVFGFIGYLVGRWISNKYYDRVKGYLTHGYKSTIDFIHTTIKKSASSSKTCTLREDILKIELETCGLVYRIRDVTQELRKTLDAYHNNELNASEAIYFLEKDHENLLSASNKVTNDHDNIAEQISNVFVDKMEECYEELLKINLTLIYFIEKIEEIFFIARKILLTKENSMDIFSDKIQYLNNLIDVFLSVN